MTTAKQINDLVELVITHLPDSIERRMEILEALLRILPEDHRGHADITLMLLTLKNHDLNQREFKITL